MAEHILRIKVDTAPDGRIVLRVEAIDHWPPSEDLTLGELTLPEGLSTLRHGGRQPTLLPSVTATVSQWLMHGPLRQTLRFLLNDQSVLPLRLLFVVERQQTRPSILDLPIELLLLEREMTGTPLVIRTGITSIAYQLPRADGGGSPAQGAKWPFRILIVRSNPKDQGGHVPSAKIVRDAILQANSALTDRHLHIDVLSRNEQVEVTGPPTLSSIKSHLTKGLYHMLVYLGHGDIELGDDGAPRSHVLRLEGEVTDAEGMSAHVAVSAAQLAAQLQDSPVPAILLVSCLTDAVDEDLERRKELQSRLEEILPQWIMGGYGVAQQLVRDVPGVCIAVGMRYRITVEEATTFIQAFFASFLCEEPGHIERAVRAARLKLHGVDRESAGWAAPVVLRSHEAEPIFAFLSDPGEVDKAPAPLPVEWETLVGAIAAQACAVFDQLVGPPDPMPLVTDSSLNYEDSFSAFRQRISLAEMGAIEQGRGRITRWYRLYRQTANVRPEQHAATAMEIAQLRPHVEVLLQHVKRTKREHGLRIADFYLIVNQLQYTINRLTAAEQSLLRKELQSPGEVANLLTELYHETYVALRELYNALLASG